MVEEAMTTMGGWVKVGRSPEFQNPCLDARKVFEAAVKGQLLLRLVALTCLLFWGPPLNTLSSIFFVIILTMAVNSFL